jgi:hypothetical protein
MVLEALKLRVGVINYGKNSLQFCISVRDRGFFICSFSTFIQDIYPLVYSFTCLRLITVTNYQAKYIKNKYNLLINKREKYGFII